MRIGEFDYVEENDKNGVNIRIYTPLNKGSEGEFSKSVRIQHFIICNVVNKFTRIPSITCTRS